MITDDQIIAMLLLMLFVTCCLFPLYVSWQSHVSQHELVASAPRANVTHVNASYNDLQIGPNRVIMPTKEHVDLIPSNPIPVIPQPVSDRFYSSYEFHPVGHLHMQNAKGNRMSFIKNGLPLLGKQLQSYKTADLEYRGLAVGEKTDCDKKTYIPEQWKYVTVCNNRVYDVVILDIRSGHARDCTGGPCANLHMIARQVPQLFVMIPQLSGTSTLWRVTLYKRL